MWNSIYTDSGGNVEIKAQNNRTPALSNLFPFPPHEDYPPLIVRGFTSVEAAYQYAKAQFFEERLSGVAFTNRIHEATGSTVLSSRFSASTASLDAKKMGGKGSITTAIAAVYGNKARASRLYDEILPEWQQHTPMVMETLLREKFGDDNPEYRDLLLSTKGLCLYEGKRRSGTIWEKGAFVENVTTSGWGLLGDVLMKIRESH